MVLVAASCGGGSGSPTTVTTTATGTTATSTTSTAVADSSTTIVGEPAVVVAPDGEVALEFPAGSLPEGIAPSDIEIRPVATSPDDPRFAGLVAAGLDLPTSYELSPDGLVFDAPVQLRLIGADGAASAFLVGEEGFEPLQPDVGATLENGEPTFLVPHFSTVSITLGDYHLWSVAPLEAQVGVPFTLPILAYRNPRGYPVDHFDYTATVTASAPITPDHMAAPPLTRVATDTFTSLVTLTCAEQGTSTVRLAGEITAPWVGVDEMFWTDSISWQVECLGSGATAEARAAGLFSGEIGVATIVGFPGDDFSAPYELRLDPCGGAVLRQGGTQESRGIFRVTLTDSAGNPLEVTVLVVGEGEDYREGYWLNGSFTPDGSISLDGVLAGGGHGFGAVPDGGTVLTLLYLLGGLQQQELGRALSDREELGWVSGAAGIVAPVGIGGETPECVPVDLFEDLFTQN
jgi:hypothetical protein